MRKFLNSVIILSLAIVLLIGQLSAASATNLNTELVVNGTAETGNISGWTDDTNANRWSSSTAYSSWALPAEGSYYFFLYNPSMDFLSGTMSQVITLTDENGLFSSISSGNVSINFSIYMYQAISVSNEAKAILEEYDAGGTLLNTSQVVNTTSSGAMGSYQINTQVNPNTRSFKVILSATLTTGGYAQFDKVSLKLVDASSGSAPVIGSDFPTSGETDAGVTYGPVPFTVSDPDAGDVNILTFTASSTNVNLIPAANITIGGSGANRTLTIVPAGNLSGESDITVTASDGSKSSGKTLHFIVHKVIAMDTNLVENSNGTDGLANWTGNTVNISATGNGFVTNSPGTYMSQNIDISKFSTLIDGGETKFVLSAEFPSTYGEVTAQFFSDIACTNPVGSSPLVHGSTPSLEQKIPANAKGVKITFRNTSSSYNNVTVRNISFKVLDDFPKITPISNQATNISAFTVPVYAYYTTESATLNATSSDQTIVPNTGISVGGSGFNRSITFTPLKNGIVTITLTLNDGTSTVTTNFKVTVLDPTVVSSVNTPTAGYYAVGQNLDFTVNFNNAITGGTSSTLPLTIGGTAVYASYLSGTSNSITYRYTIGGNDTGVVAIGNAIDDTSSPIIDEIGHDADTELSAGATGITVVKTPQVTSTATEGSATYGDNITFTATLNCTDSLTGTIQFKANGSNLGSPVTVSGNAASFETESMLSAGSVSITAVFVPSGTTYHFTSLTSNVYALVVQQKSVTISGLTATAKTYDGTTSVTLSGGTLVGALTGEDVSAVCPTAGTAASKNAGTQSVAFTTIVLSGTAKDNYTLTAQPSVSVVISPKPVTATVNINNKAYDGNTNAAVTCGFTSGDIVTGDTVTVTAVGTFDTKDSGTGKTVTISGIVKSGASKDNYTISVPTSGTANITPAAITVTPNALTKVYGQNDPALTYGITSGALAASETLAGSLTRVTGENVGQYEITQGTVTNDGNPNYNIIFTTGVKLTITQATPTVTVTVDKTTQIKGKDVVVTVTVTYPNKTDNDAYPATVLFTPVNAVAKGTITVNGNQYSQTFTVGSNLTIPATFSASVTSNGNYAGASSTVPAAVTVIDQYTPTVCVSSDKGTEATYGDTVVFTATVSDSHGVPRGKVQFYVDATACGSELVLAADGTAELSLATAPLTVGNRTVTAKYIPAADETDYKTNTSSGYSITIAQKSVSISGLTATAKTYDGTTSVTLSGGTLVGALTGEDVSAVCPTAGTAASKNAGTQNVAFTTIVLSGTAKDNYILTAQPSVSLVISPKPVTATVNISNKAYDGNTNAAVTCGFTSGDIVTGDTVTVTAVGTFDTKDSGTGKTVTISGIVKSGASKDNYTISVPTSGTANITPAAITVTPNALTKVYGQNDPALTYGITSGALAASETLAGSLARVTGENVGQYEITQGTVTNDGNPNYNITFTAGIKLTITQATPTVTVTVDKTTQIKGKDVVVTATVTYPNKTENDAYPATVLFTPVNAVAKGTITINGNQYSQTFTVGSNLTIPATFSASVTSNGNYAGASSTVPATVTVIDQYTPTVSVSSDKGTEATYGDTVVFTATVSDSHGVPRGKVQFYVDATACGSELVLAADGTAELSLATAPLTVGNRTVTAQYIPAADETDYKANTSSGYSITIAQKSVSISGLTAAAKTYDGTTSVTLSGGTLVGALTGEDVSAVCPTAGTAASKNAGTQSVTFTTIVLSGTAKDNYILTAQPSVSVVISPKPVTATVNISNKAYDGNTNAAVTCGFTSGDIVTGDTVTVTAVGTFDTKDSGTGKTVTISGIVKSGASKDNYTISVPTSGTANITPAAITVTPDVLTKVYGQNDPALTYRITVGALVASETLVGSLARVTGENVGQYEITQGTVTNDGNPNYNITFTTGIKLTITQATPEITLTSNKVAGYAVYGDPVTFTATAHQSGSGSVPAGSVQFWLDSEKLGSPVMLTLGSASYSTTQTDLLVGDRSVTAEFIPDTGEINYITNTSVAYVISIGKREVTIKADDKTIYVGDLIPKANSLTYTVDGLIGGDSLLTPPTLSLPIDVSSSVAASYTIMVTGAGVSDKYTLNIINGTLRVIQPEMEADTTPSELSQTILVWASAQTSKIAAASVTADQISQAISAVMRETPQEDASPFVEITLQNAGYVNTVKITVPKAAVDYLEQNGLGLQLNTPIGTITFNADALSVISQNAGGNINFQIKRLDPASLPETVRAAVGDRPVYDFTVTSGNGIVSSFGGENITVKVPYDIKDGENPNAIVVYYIDDDGNMTPVCGGYNPEERAVYFTIAHLSQYAIVYNEVTYTDVPQSAWYYNAVTFCAARGITTGLGNGFFGPNDPLTRGQFIVLLMRAYGLTIDEKPIDNFSDAGDTYYTGYLASAKRLGITTGVGSNMFMPDEVITRQDMFTLLYRVLAVLGQLPEMKEDASLSSFADADKISDYAKDAMENLISAGIVSGSGGNLDPLGISTRAQMAQLLYKLLT